MAKADSNNTLFCEDGKRGWKAILFFSVVMIFITLAPLASLDSFGGMAAITSGTQRSLAPLTTNLLDSLVTLVYLSVVIVMPVFLIAFGGYVLMKKKSGVALHLNPEQSLHDLPYGSLDHQFHLFPYVEKIKKQETTHGSIQTKSVVFKTNDDYQNAALHPFLKDKLLKGYTTEELHNELGKFGWNKETVNLAVRDLGLEDREVDIVLSSYIMRCLSEGNSLNSIRDALHSKGWNKQKVDGVLEKVNSYVLNNYQDM